MPKVSICTPVYNDAELLRGMIASVVGQSFKDWELIVVDDGSEQDIKAEVDYWADERVLYNRIEHQGSIPACNLALSLAQGEYIGFLSADERLDLNKLLWQVGYLDDHLEISGVWGLPHNGELGERPEWEQYQLKAHNRSQAAWVRTLLNLESIPIGGASSLIRASVLKDIGGFDPRFKACSDLELFVRFFEKYKGIVFPYRWAWCVDKQDTIGSQTKPEDFRKEIAEVQALHLQPIPELGGRVTIAIPVKDMAKYIGETLKSIRLQTHKDYEVMIVDDASTDNLYEVLCQFSDMNLQIFKFDENRGCNAAQNHMLGLCKTPFFMVLAADDTLDPRHIEKCMAKFKENPWTEFVASQTDFINDSGGPYTEDHPMKKIVKVSNKPKDTWLAQMYYGNQYFGCGIYRTEAIKDVGGWRTDVSVLADYDVYLKLLQRETIVIVEEDLTHTRIHDSNRSVLKTKQEQIDLRKHYFEIKKHYYAPRMKVIVATPFYEMRGFSPYISSMYYTSKALTSLGILSEFWELSGDSYIDRAKNTLMNKFLEDPEATDLFMIDADMQWDVQAFINMLMLPEEIVMGSYPQKNMWETWTAIPEIQEEEDGRKHPIGRVLDDGSALIKAAYLAGGFIRYKRAALEKYKEQYKDLVYYDPGADPGYQERLYTEFFCCERAPGPNEMPLRWGEDRVFGKRMKAIGVEGWIYPKLDVGHYGVKGWMGNFDTHLRKGATQ